MSNRSAAWKDVVLTEEQVSARNALCMANMPLAMFWAKKVWMRPSTKAYPFADVDDLRQVCVLGLLAACEQWDPARGKLSTLASLCMRKQVNEYLLGGGLIRVPSCQRWHDPEGYGAVLERSNPEAMRPENWESCGCTDPDPDLDSEVVDAVRSLPDQMASDVTARYWDGLSYPEIGACNGNTKQAAQSMVRRALAKLAVALAAYRYTDSVEG